MYVRQVCNICNVCYPKRIYDIIIEILKLCHHVLQADRKLHFFHTEMSCHNLCCT